jgi:hypothetical protein
MFGSYGTVWTVEFLYGWHGGLWFGTVYFNFLSLKKQMQ